MAGFADYFIFHCLSLPMRRRLRSPPAFFFALFFRSLPSSFLLLLSFDSQAID